MEGTSVANLLPALYRAVLAHVASLERNGHRREAELVRREAVEAYSRAWDDAAYRRLDQLRMRAERVLEGHERPRAAPPLRSAFHRPRPA